MYYGFIQTIIVITILLVLNLADIVNGNRIFLILFLNLLSTVWIEKNDSSYIYYIKKESLAIGIVSIFLFIVGMHKRDYFFELLFIFYIKPIYFFVKYNNIRLKLYSIFLILCYLCPIFYLFLKKEQINCAEKENSVVSYLAAINIVFAVFLMFNSIMSKIYPTFGSDMIAVFLCGTIPTELILCLFLSINKISVYSYCKYGVLLLIPFFPLAVSIFLLWSIYDSCRIQYR